MTLGQNYPQEPDELTIGYTTEDDDSTSLSYIPFVAKSSSESDRDPEPSLRRKPRPIENATCTLSRVNSVITLMSLTQRSVEVRQSVLRGMSLGRGVSRT